MAKGLERIFGYRMEKFLIKKECRLCGSTSFAEVLDLGNMPLANAFLTDVELAQDEGKYPLAVHFCTICKSVQLKHTVSPDILFKKYHYMTGASKPLAEHFYRMAEEIADKHTGSADDLVVEIGSNDGSLLSKIKDRVRVLGVDPADNVVEAALALGVRTKVGFFDTKLAGEIQKEHGKAKVIVANNVMAHIDNLRDVFLGVKELLADDGVFIFEVHWVGNLLTDGGFDQIYHEHIYYHSLHSLKTLLESIGMIVGDIQLVPIHGESMRVFARKSGKASVAVKDFLEREVEMGLVNPDTYKNFSKKVEAGKKVLVELLQKLKKEGKKIVGYGAPAKGNTLLNYFNIGKDTLDYITDSTPAKQGTYTPGTHIRVVHPSILETETPDYVLLLSWNYAKQILEKEKVLRDKGVKFIIPVPEVRIV